VADETCPEPLYELSLIYETGIPPIVLEDMVYSRNLLIEAAELQYAPAQYKLAYCFEQGKNGFPVDLYEGIKLYQIAALSGFAEAQLAFSGWLLSGCPEVLDRNEREAFLWAQKAALQRHPRAEYTLGYFLELGIGVAVNLPKALKWYAAASKHGDALARKRLVDINAHVPIDLMLDPNQRQSEKKRKGFQLFRKR
jgi:TPR repeat protein